jgi:hypothetical protein
MIGWLRLKISFSIALLFSLVVSQPGLAKGAHVAHKGASAKGTNSVHTKPAEKLDASVTIQPQRGGLARDQRNPNASLKIAKPENLTRRPNVTAPFKPPVLRNAIGQPVNSKSMTLDASRLAPSPRAPRTIAKGAVRIPSPTSPVHPANVGSTSVRPTVTASTSRGRIDGAHLIRPSVAPLGVGGPARASNGINGTTVRTKHY